jgi:hypothetical protein
MHAKRCIDDLLRNLILIHRDTSINLSPDGNYDCVDRIILNACFSMGQTGGGFRTWWRALYASHDKLNDMHLMRMAGRFSRRLRPWAILTVDPDGKLCFISPIGLWASPESILYISSWLYTTRRSTVFPCVLSACVKISGSTDDHDRGGAETLRKTEDAENRSWKACLDSESSGLVRLAHPPFNPRKTWNCIRAQRQLLDRTSRGHTPPSRTFRH